MLYLYGINWALQTLTTVGYGDINAKMTTERTVALIWMIFGVGFYSFTIGNLASIISAIDKRAAHLQEKL
jgi:hyperpolarization activated cyclic nucleotide-gated potassium channel 2